VIISSLLSYQLILKVDPLFAKVKNIYITHKNKNSGVLKHDISEFRFDVRARSLIGSFWEKRKREFHLQILLEKEEDFQMTSIVKFQVRLN